MVFLVFVKIDVQAQAESQCLDLFKEVKTEAIKSKVEAESFPENKVHVNDKAFNTNMFDAAIELTRYLLSNPSHRIEEKLLGKDKIVLSVPLENGFYADVTYISSGRSGGRFVIDKIEIKSPNEILVDKIEKESFLHPTLPQFVKNKFKLKSTNEFNGLSISLNIPLEIPDAVLENFDKITKYFGLYDKDNLRSMIMKMSPKKVLRHFRIKYILTEIYETFAKQRIKDIVKFTPLIFIGGFFISKETIQEYKFWEQTQKSFVEARLEKVENTTASQVVRQQVAKLRTVINEQIQSKTAQLAHPHILGIDFNTLNKYSMQHQFWVYEKIDPITNVMKTYFIILHNSLSDLGIGKLQYYIQEVNPLEYVELIQLIKASETAVLTQAQ